MSGIHLKDLSKVYKEQIAEKKDDSYLETDMKKRQKNNEKARKDMKKMGSMSNPHFGDGPTGSMSSEEVEVEEGYGTGAAMIRGGGKPKKKVDVFAYDRKLQAQGKLKGKKLPPAPTNEALDPVGKEDGDVNNDGKKDSTDSYLMKRRKAIGKAIKKKMSEGVRDMNPEKGTAERKARLEKKRGMKLDDHPQYKKEEYIPEVMSDDMDDKPIKEKKVKNVVKINPKLGESVEEIGGELIEAVEIFDILEEITDQELRFISDRMIDEIVEEFFIEAAEQDEDLEVLQQNLCESIDLSISLLLEQDAGAEARKRLGSGPSRASVMDRVKSAVKKHGPTVKAGLKKAGKAVARGAGYAAGATVRGAKAAGREFSKGYERGRTGSSDSSSSSDSESSSAPKKKGPGLLSRIGAKLKRGIGKAARAVSRGARNVARKMDEEIINERGDFWHPDPDEDRKLGGPGANQRAREDRGSSKPAAKKDTSKSLKPGESYMQYAKRKQAEKAERAKKYGYADRLKKEEMGEGYGAPGHNPGSGEKAQERTKKWMEKKGMKGAPGLNAMAARKAEHEARRGVKKEEVEQVDENRAAMGRINKEYHRKKEAEAMAARTRDPKVKRDLPKRKNDNPMYDPKSAGSSRVKGFKFTGEEVEHVDEAMRPGERQRKMAAKRHDPYATSRDRATAHNVAVRNDGPGTPGYEKKSTGGKGARYAGYGDQGAGNKARRRAGQEPLRGTRTEEASMSPQEVQLQRKKSMIDKMIATKRMQGLKKSASAEPAKAMGEATEDSLRDRRMERGGVGGNVDYKRAPKFAPGPSKKKYDGMSALDVVKADIRKKHGKGAIMDTKKK